MRLTFGFRKVLAYHVSVCSELLYLDLCDKVELSDISLAKSYLAVGKFLMKPSKCFNHDNSRNQK